METSHVSSWQCLDSNCRLKVFWCFERSFECIHCWALAEKRNMGIPTSNCITQAILQVVPLLSTAKHLCLAISRLMSVLWNCRMMSDWDVELTDDSISEFHVLFKGPKDSKPRAPQNSPSLPHSLHNVLCWMWREILVVRGQIWCVWHFSVCCIAGGGQAWSVAMLEFLAVRIRLCWSNGHIFLVSHKRDPIILSHPSPPRDRLPIT